MSSTSCVTIHKYCRTSEGSFLWLEHYSRGTTLCSSTLRKTCPKNLEAENRSICCVYVNIIGTQLRFFLKIGGQVLPEFASLHPPFFIWCISSRDYFHFLCSLNCFMDVGCLAEMKVSPLSWTVKHIILLRIVKHLKRLPIFNIKLNAIVFQLYSQLIGILVYEVNILFINSFLTFIYLFIYFLYI